MVSRFYCTLENRGGNIFITDGNAGENNSCSTNGTFLNGVKIKQGVWHNLQPSDEVRFGNDKWEECVFKISLHKNEADVEETSYYSNNLEL